MPFAPFAREATRPIRDTDKPDCQIGLVKRHFRIEALQREVVRLAVAAIGRLGVDPLMRRITKT